MPNCKLNGLDNISGVVGTDIGSGMIPFEDVKKHFTAVCMIECK